MRWREGRVVPILLAAVSCSSPGGTSEMLRLAGTSLRLEPDRLETLHSTTIEADTQRAFGVLTATYQELGLPVTYRDPSALQMGGTMPTMLDVGGEPNSTWLDCGSGLTVTPRADDYNVTITVATRVVAMGQASSVETVVRAAARTRNVSGGIIPCTSRLTLERRIAELVVARVASN